MNNKQKRVENFIRSKYASSSNIFISIIKKKINIDVTKKRSLNKVFCISQKGIDIMLKHRYICSFVFCTIISIILISNSISTASVIKRLNMIFDKSGDLITTILSTVFTGYILFQALTDKKQFIKILLIGNESEEEIKSKLEEFNSYFIEIIFITFSFVVLNFFCGILIDIINAFIMSIYHKFMFLLMYDLYFFILTNVFIEFFCFVYNLYNVIFISIISNIDKKELDDDTKR